jgi:hypothetical protein
MGGVVEVFDVGAVDTEHVLDACGGKLIDDVIDDTDWRNHLTNLFFRLSQ